MESFWTPATPPMSINVIHEDANILADIHQMTPHGIQRQCRFQAGNTNGNQWPYVFQIRTLNADWFPSLFENWRSNGIYIPLDYILRRQISK